MATQIDNEALTAEDDSTKILNNLRSQGFEVAGLKEVDDEGKRGADIMVTLHHALGERTWTGPLYMTTGEGGANSLLKYRFSAEGVRLNGLDPKWVNKRVWYADKQKRTDDITSELRCPLSAHQSDEDKAAVRAKGFQPQCRVGKTDVTFATPDRVAFHVEKRHPRYLAANKDMEEKAERLANSDMQRTMMEAILKLAETKAK